MISSLQWLRHYISTVHATLLLLRWSQPTNNSGKRHIMSCINGSRHEHGPSGISIPMTVLCGLSEPNAEITDVSNLIKFEPVPRRLSPPDCPFPCLPADLSAAPEGAHPLPPPCGHYSASARPHPEVLGSCWDTPSLFWVLVRVSLLEADPGNSATLCTGW